MDFSVGDKVRLADGRVGVIARINAAGRFDVNLNDDDPVAAATRGHAALRPDEPVPEDMVVENVAAGDLAKVA